MLPLYLVFYFVAALHFINLYPSLPDIIPVHFNPAGEADGWRSAASFAKLHWGFIFLMSGIFVVLAQVIKRLPHRSISIPNRDYWMTKERAAETVERLVDSISLMGIIAGGFVVAVDHQIMKAAIKGGGPADIGDIKTTAMWAGGLITLLVIRLFIKFRKPPALPKKTAPKQAAPKEAAPPEPEKPEAE